MTLLPSELNQGMVPDLPAQGEGFAYNFASDVHDYLNNQQGTLSLMWNDLIGIVTRLNHDTGSFGITGTASSTTVNLPYAQGDTSYLVFTQPITSGAQPITSITKTTQSFTATVATAPAAGVTWNYTYLLLR
jgi:hypothetical protein